MTQRELDKLFDQVRKSPSETSVEDVTLWLTGATTSALITGSLAAKLKLFISQKYMIMLASTLGTIGVITLSAIYFNSPTANKHEKALSNVQLKIEQKVQPKKSDPLTINFQEDITPQMSAVKKIEPPISMPYKNVSALSPFPTVISKTIRPISLPEFPTQLSTPEKVNDQLINPTIKNTGNKKLVGNGNVIRQERPVSPFNEIEISGIFDVYLSQGETEKIEVETDENLQEFIITNIQDGKLKLDCKRESKIKKSSKMNIYVTIKDIRSFYTSGIGDVKSTSTLNFGSIKITTVGVGDVKLDLNCDDINLKTSGVGDVSLEGSANHGNFRCKGVGDLNAYKFIVHKMILEHNGVGDANVYVDSEISIDYSGVGDLNYKGDPIIKKLNKTGVGDIKSK